MLDEELDRSESGRLADSIDSDHRRAGFTVGSPPQRDSSPCTDDVCYILLLLIYNLLCGTTTRYY